MVLLLTTSVTFAYAQSVVTVVFFFRIYFRLSF